MANFHYRSNSLPSNSHPVVDDVEEQLCRLRSSEATSTSSTSLCTNLASLVDLYKGINSLIQMPSVQQVLTQERGECWINEVLEGSLGLVDLCQFSTDVVRLTKESVQELESSIRRKRGETGSVDDINAYAASRKMIAKMVNKYFKNLKGFNRNSSSVADKDHEVKHLEKMLKEAEVLGFSVLKSVLKVISEEKGRSNHRNGSLLSKFIRTNRVHSEAQQESGAEDFSLNIYKSRKSMDNVAMQKQLKHSEMSIQELEEGLECYFRSLVKTRASFLNVLSH